VSGGATAIDWRVTPALMASVEHGRLEHAVTAVIVANTVVLVAGLVVDGHEQLFEKVDLAILWFFAAELSVRLAMARLGFFHSLWNIVDAVIILVALLPVAGGGIAVLRLARLARSAHLLRHVSHLRLWRLVRHLIAA
jgi:voltage-gated sodium channel